ncbi:hypothetical protein RhiirA4_549529 [Rhizophagus irregularis]|uniref:Uncharacterized protein n=1 Tax=Rhizophagus irregularis TaxID=588596 RepID=A0A2I1HE54_9GLOM|nr:hypothetical protein RhiirA4_549529 [Rhizophagus irregularis]
MSEKELHSKICVVQSIKPPFSEARDEVVDNDASYKLACNFATIFARDNDLIAVKLKISDGYIAYISKFNPWHEKDDVYINKIEEYLRNMSKDSSKKSKANPDALTSEVLSYCSYKLESRIKKLYNDLIRNPDEEYIKSFIGYASANLKGFEPKKLHYVNKLDISVICQSYYEQLDKIDNEIPQKFLGHLRKVASYVASAINITKCASNVKYKNLFSNIELHMIDSIGPVISKSRILSWENVIKSFVRNHEDYERFRDECLKNDPIATRLKRLYYHYHDGEFKLDDDNIEILVFVHAEMKLLVNMIDQKDKSKSFIAVSSAGCCYLCELYIDFARKRGYNIITSGKCGRIRDTWKFPPVASIDFRFESLKYILKNLDRIIENKIKLVTDADSDSDTTNSPDSHRQEIYRFIMGDDFQP